MTLSSSRSTALAGLLLFLLPALPARSELTATKQVAPSEVELGEAAEVTLTVRAEPEPDPFPLDVVLVLDKSETMEGALETDDPIKFQGALDVAEALNDELLAVPGTQVGLVSFGGTTCNPGINADSECEGLSVAGVPQGTFDDLRTDPLLPSGLTPLADAIEQAQAHLESNAARDHAVPVLIILSDGIESVGDASDVADAADEARERGTTIVTVSFGEDDDPTDAIGVDLLQLIADGDLSFHEPPPGDADEVISALMEIPETTVARQVEVIEILGDGLHLVGGVTVTPLLGESPFPLHGPPQIVGQTVTLSIPRMRDNDAYRIELEVVARECGELLVDDESSRVEWLGPDGPPVESEPFQNRTLTVTGEDCEPDPPPPSAGELGAILACFFECKAGEEGAWQEITTLLLANLEPRRQTVANLTLVVRDGVTGPAIGVIEDTLGALDLDEIHICRSLEAAGLSAPSAGRIDVLQRNVVTVPNARPLRVYGWMKNVVGKQHHGVNEPFSTQNRVSSIGKTECRIVPIVEHDEIEDRLEAVSSLPRVSPILVEDTRDPTILAPSPRPGAQPVSDRSGTSDEE
jgi:hypothetical protein